MRGARAFVGLGSNEGDAYGHLTAAFAALDEGAVRVAGAGRLVWSPYVGAPRGVLPPRVLNTVAEVRTELEPEALHARLSEIEQARGRVRDGRHTRALDLDLLAYDDVVCVTDELTLPHPRARQRAFVLAPWTEVAPRYVLPGSAHTIVEHATALLRDDPAQDGALRVATAPPFADRAAPCTRLTDRESLARWRDGCRGTVGVVMTMGALHAGHAALVQRAAAECDHVLATVFVNPTQFGEGEDLARYPRTLDDDIALLARHGADAVYVPSADDMYPDGLATTWEPSGAALGFEGALRPGHFAGVVTVVTELWRRTRADRSYFGRKDAQQLAVLAQVRAERALPVEIVACPIVRAEDELALSSRNRYLDGSTRLIAREFALALRGLGALAARGRDLDGVPMPFEPARDLAAVRAHLAGRGFGVDYLELVDPDTLAPCTELDRPRLVIGAARLGGVRLLDNRWLAPPAAEAP